MIRGREVSRIEGFTDAVFGFAVTLLVVSLEVPEDFVDLQRILLAFPSFAVTFTLICWVWYEHYLLFRRYELEDGLTVVLNSVLLFIILFYAYPLKFMFTRLVNGSMLGTGPGISEGMTDENGRLLMLVYSGGFVALFGTFMLLHWNAWRQRESLKLDELARYDARANIKRHLISVTVGLLSIAIAVILPIDYLPFAGLIFFLMGPAHGAFGYVNGRQRERFAASVCQASGTPPPVTRSAGASSV